MHIPDGFIDARTSVAGAAAAAGLVGVSIRKAARDLDDLVEWLSTEGEVAIYDATNSTLERRAEVRKRCESAGCAVLFIEIVCDDPAIIEANIRTTKLDSSRALSKSASMGTGLAHAIELGPEVNVARCPFVLIHGVWAP